MRLNPAQIIKERMEKQTQNLKKAIDQILNSEIKAKDEGQDEMDIDEDNDEERKLKEQQ